MSPATLPGVRYLLRGLGDLLFPETCLCGANPGQADGLCEDCKVLLTQHVAVAFCPRCGASIGPNLRVYETCSACPNPLPRFEQVFRLGSYAPPIRTAICQLKYQGRLGPAEKLTDLLAGRIEAGIETPLDVVCPVPMHFWRRWTRGRDHADALAKRLGKRLSLPVGSLLRRIRNTPQQIHLSRTARRSNVRDAFASTRPLDGASVLLVDDVTTTGATADECARMLKKAGASHVQLAVLAKAEPTAAYAEYSNTAE